MHAAHLNSTLSIIGAQVNGGYYSLSYLCIIECKWEIGGNIANEKLDTLKKIKTIELPISLDRKYQRGVYVVIWLV